MTVAVPDVVTRTRALAEVQGRRDLVSRLDHTTRRLADPSVRVLVVGEFKQGKSDCHQRTGRPPVCPVDDDVATAVPMEVRYGAQPQASLLIARRGTTGTGGSTDLEEVRVGIETVTGSIAGGTERSDGRTVVGAKAWLPRSILQSGLVLVDTPGVGGLGSSHSASTLAALPTADAVILVSDASSEFTAPEVTFLRQALDACPTVVVASRRPTCSRTGGGCRSSTAGTSNGWVSPCRSSRCPRSCGWRRPRGATRASTRSPASPSWCATCIPRSSAAGGSCWCGRPGTMPPTSSTTSRCRSSRSATPSPTRRPSPRWSPPSTRRGRGRRP